MGKSLADAFDAYLNWIILFLFITALNLSLEACAYIVNEAMGVELRAWAQWAARAGNVSLVISMIVWIRLVSRKKQQQRRRLFRDEFVMETMKSSASISFILTICFVAILDIVVNNSPLPADFYIKLVGVSLTAGFSISFVLINFLGTTHSPEESQTE